jgi:hypothetical protein
MLNFRLFMLPSPLCIGWVDASWHVVGDILVRLETGACGAMPVTADNWMMDALGPLPKIHNCARMQVDMMAKQPVG